jgi:hypothetical protein
MYKFILVLALASSSAFASSNILPETKNARNPASDSPPALDQVRVLVPDKTFQRTGDGSYGRISLEKETCGNPRPAEAQSNAEGWRPAKNVTPPWGQTPPECSVTVSTAASTKAYIDYIENQLAQKLDLYIKALDQKASEKIEQRLKDPSCQERLQNEAIRILEANAALRNQ